MALFDGSVQPTQGEQQRMENMDGLRKNIRSVEQESITKVVKENRHGVLTIPRPSKPEAQKEEPSEQGEEKSTAQRYRERYSRHWSDDTKESAKELFMERKNGE